MSYEAQSDSRDGPSISIDVILVVSIFLTFLAIVGRQALAAPIRAYLPGFWYLPDMLVMGTACLYFVVAIANGRTAGAAWLSFVAAWSLLSLMALHELSVMFGLRMLLAFVMAILAGLYFRPLEGLIRLSMVVLCGLAIVGAIYDSLFDLPWSGMVFEGAFGTNDISRTWWTEDETRRIAGLGIASTDTALFIVCAMLLISTGSDRLSRLSAVLLVAPAMYAVWLAQQRATMVWFAFFWVVACLLPVVMGRRVVPGVNLVLQSLVLAALAACLTVPFLFYEVDIGSMVGITAVSLLDRTMVVWPYAIERLSEFPTILTGAGVGSVGEAMAFTNPALSVPPDNIFLYLYTMCGIGSLVLVAMVFSHVLTVDKEEDSVLMALSLLAILLFNGVTANIFSGLVGIAFLGFAIGVLWSSQNQEYI